MGVFEWNAARLYVPEKIKCRTYIWRDGRLACGVLESLGTRTSFEDSNGLTRWVYTFEFIAFYMQLLFDVAWASDILRPASHSVRDELRLLSVLQVGIANRLNNTSQRNATYHSRRSSKKKRMEPNFRFSAAFTNLTSAREAWNVRRSVDEGQGAESWMNYHLFLRHKM